MLDFTPVSFYPPNFTWVSIMEPMLIDIGVKNVVLDSSHYTLSCKTQVWKWSSQTEDKLNTLLKDTVIDNKEVHKIYHLNKYGQNENQKTIYVFFRDFAAIEKLSFGNTGMFHQPYNWKVLQKYCQDLLSKLQPKEFVTLADDGDRINPVSIQNYTLFLREFISHPFYRLADLSDANYTFSDIPYLPSFSIGDHQSFWLSDLDGIHYKNLLDQVYQIKKNIQSDYLEEKIMDLQDVYFLFWKTISRKKYYLEKIYNILKKNEENIDGHSK